MFEYKQYPITIVPNAILEAQRSTIPITVNPSKPVRPIPPKMVYIGLILTLVSIATVVAFYSFSNLMSNIWIQTITVVFFATSVIIAIFNFTSNRIKILTHRKEQEGYEYLMRQYTNDMQIVDEINRKNNDRATLSQYRKEKVTETLLKTNCLLKPTTTNTPTINTEFYQMLSDYFVGKVLINYTVSQNSYQTQYTSNYIVSVSEKKLYIDVEIDTPYDLETRQPISYIYNNTFSKQAHNQFFEQQGWVVIRFCEEQIIKQPRSCCKYIAQIIYEIIEDDTVLQNFNTVDTIDNINVWTLEQCKKLEQEKYRESYITITKPNNTMSNINEEETNNNLESTENQQENQTDGRQVKILPIYMNTIDEPNDEPTPEQTPEPIPEQTVTPEPIEETIPKTELENKTEYNEPIFSDARSAEKKNFVELVAKMNECHNLEQWENLLDCCNTIITIDPSFQLAYLRRSAAYGNLGQLEKAIDDCETIIKINPNNPDAYYNAAVANLMLKRYQNAINYFQKAIDNKIQHTDEVYLTLAGIYNKIGDQSNYNEYLQQSATLGNQTARIMIIKQKQNEGKNAGTQFQGFNTRNIKIAREGVSDIAFSYNDEYMAVADQSRQLRVFDTTSWNAIYKQDVSVSAIAFSRNNKYMAIGGQSFLRILSINNGHFELFSDIINYTGNIKKIFFHPFNNETLFVSDSFSLYKVDIKSKVINKTINDFRLMSVSRDMQYIAGCDYFNSIKIYRINALSEIFKLNECKVKDIKAMAINNDASRLIYGTKDGLLSVYNPQIPTEVSVKNIESEIYDIKIGSGSAYFTTLCSDRRLRFFNTSTANVGREIQMQFLPKLIVTSNSNNMLVMGNFNEDIDIVYVNESVINVPTQVQRTA